MTKQIIFQDSFLVSGIMCFDGVGADQSGGCGTTIQVLLNECEIRCKKGKIIPEDAQLSIGSEPQTLGIHRIFITIESESPDSNWNHSVINNEFKNSIDECFEVISDTSQTSQKNDSTYTNLINIAVNLVAIALITVLSILITPSLYLTAGLTLLTFLTTTFTTRDYIINFLRNLRTKNFANMTTTVTAGWFLSLAHTLYHSITMPLASSFSMVFMSFLMPVMLITIINGMDEIKRLVLNKTQKMHLQSVTTLFPQMATQYDCQDLSPADQQAFSCLSEPRPSGSGAFVIPQNDRPTMIVNKNALKKGMIIHIPMGTCFPVDCRLVDEKARVDSSLLTGEPQQNKHQLDFIPAGAINLGPLVHVYALSDPYNSTITKLLFRSNRELKRPLSKANNNFTNSYIALNLVGLSASILIPATLGVMSIPLLLQNITGILFAICPCTLAIAHELPSILSSYQRSRKGIVIRDENLRDKITEMHTIVFDKTGTLTTGDSEVESIEGIEADLLKQIYLLEKSGGGGHPLAKAVINHYESINPASILENIEGVVIDFQRRGLSIQLEEKLIRIGNLEYLLESGIQAFAINHNKLRQGLSPIYVAEDAHYKGVIYIKHTIRDGVPTALACLDRQGIRIMLLSGDKKEAVRGLNRQLGSIFNSRENIHAGCTPQGKEAFIETILIDKPSGVWFIGDGLNDAPCAKMVSEKGGVSCAITPYEKASFFTDISLNGSLDYLFAHNHLNQFLQKITQQNQSILIYGSLLSITFIITFSILSLPVSPIIPLMIMASTTLMVLLNSYRMQLEVDNVLDKNKVWLTQVLASDLSLGLLMGSSLLFSCGFLLSTIAAAGFVLPFLILAADIMIAISSVLFITFALLATAHLCTTAPLLDNRSEDPCLKSSQGSLGSGMFTFFFSAGRSEALRLDSEPRPSGSGAFAI